MASTAKKYDGMKGGNALRKGWKIWRFDQIATIVNDRVDNPAEANVEYYVGLEHLDTDSLKIRRWGKPGDVEATKLRFRKGDIIFGRRRVYQRKLGVADFDGICSAHAMVLRAKLEVVLPDFLPFFMQGDLFMKRAMEISVGSLSPTINWKTLAAQEFALPPKAQQLKIVEVLRAIEEVSNALDETESNADFLLRALSKREFVHRGVSSQLLSDHYTIISGQVDPKQEWYATLPLIAPNHIESRTGRLLKIESAFGQSAISGKYLFEEGSVLYSKIRPNLVKAVIAPCRGLCSADMYALVPKASIRNVYLLEILLSDSFTQYAVSGSMRTGIPKLNREHLSQYRCRVPTQDEQDKYLESVRAVRAAKQEQLMRKKQNKELKAMMLMEAVQNGI